MQAFAQLTYTAGAEAKLAELLAGVEMPEPVGYVSTHNTPEASPYRVQFNKTLAHVYTDTAKSIDAVFTLTQLQAAVAAAVAKKDVQIAAIRAAHQRYEADTLTLAQQDDEVRAALTADRDALAKDAARYRWLREGNFTGQWLLKDVAGGWTTGMDAAIDAALEKTK